MGSLAAATHLVYQSPKTAKPRHCRGFACKSSILVRRRAQRDSVFYGLHLAPVAAPEVHVAAERAFAGGVAALHRDRALRQRGAGHFDHAEPALAALDVLEHLEVDLVREHLLDAPEERVAVFLERVQEPAIHAKACRRIDDFLALRRAFLAFEQLFSQKDQPPTAERPAICAGRSAV